MKIAVIIPAHNEEKVIEKTISSCLAAGIEKEDVYVVNDASADKTAEAASAMKINLLSLEQNGGKANALKHGVKHFRLCERYDYVMFLDADSEIEKDCRENFAKSARENGNVALFVGQVKSKPGNYISSFRLVEYCFGQNFHKTGQSKRGLLFIAPGCASMYKTDILAKLNFDGDTLAEDMDLTMQIQRMNEKIIYVPAAVVLTQDPRNLKDYAKQIARWYKGVWQVVKKYRVIGRRGKTGTDWLVTILAIDALVFNKLFWVAVLCFFSSPKIIKTALLLDVLFTFALAVYAAIKERRADALYNFPVYFWLSYLNHAVFLKSFIEIMILKKRNLIWNKCKRY